jgi:glycosyltransferase involved in cell wall biosynthesis
MSEMSHQASTSERPLVFISSCPELWGGSEELWSGAACVAATEGRRVVAFKYGELDLTDRRYTPLRNAGVTIESTESWPWLRKAVDLMNGFLPESERWHGVRRTQPYMLGRIRSLSPDLAVVAQCDNFDGLEPVSVCLEAGVPYVLICNKASDFNWPPDVIRPFLRDVFLGARRVFFVSAHNRDLTECQIGTRLPNSEVISNPFLVDYHQPPLPYPEPGADGVFRMACVARFWVQDKGQDILLRVLAMEKWRQRHLEVHFFGSGAHREALRDFAVMIGAKGAHIGDFKAEVTDIWKEYHALILPSRAEGLPLALLEAMLCGRMAVCTPAGGVAEVLEDGTTGFLAEGATPEALDAALERAWERRHEWGAMGALAAERIRNRVCESPCRALAEKIEAIRKGIRG